MQTYKQFTIFLFIFEWFFWPRLELTKPKAKSFGISFSNVEFQFGVTNNGNLLSFWPKDTRGTVVFDFEIGLATIELSDANVKVGLCDEKGLFKQIDVRF